MVYSGRPNFHTPAESDPMYAKPASALLLLLILMDSTRADEVDVKSTAVKAAEKAGVRFTRDLGIPLSRVVATCAGTDEQIKLLAQVEGLEEVGLGGEATDAGLARLLPMKNLKALGIEHNRKVTDAGMKTIAKLNGLESLHFNGAIVGSEEGIKALKGLKSLRHLSLYGTRVKDAGVNHIGEMTDLLSLNLGNTYITDEAMLAVGKLTKLNGLDLSATDISDVGVKHLKRLKSLVWIDFTVLNSPKTQLTDKSIDIIAGYKKLQSIRLSTSAMTAKTLAKLANLTELQEVNFIVWTRPNRVEDGQPLIQYGQTKQEIDELGKLFPRECLFTADRGFQK